jgi:hypothetical protein
VKIIGPCQGIEASSRANFEKPMGRNRLGARRKPKIRAAGLAFLPRLKQG